MQFRWLTPLLFSLFFSDFARGQTIKNDEMSFTLGRLTSSPACGAQCAEFIVAQGEIRLGSLLHFLGKRRLAGDRDLPLIISSNGGIMDGAQFLAQALRLTKATVIVANASATCIHGAKKNPCNPADKADGIQTFTLKAQGVCASACTLLFAGATKRIAATDARFGVHRPGYVSHVNGSTQIKTEQELERKMIDRYLYKVGNIFAEFGVDSDLMRRAALTSSDKMDWLSLADASKYNLVNASIYEVSGNPKLVQILRELAN